MNLNKKFKKNGYIFFKLNNKTKLLITKINNLIIKYKKEKKLILMI